MIARCSAASRVPLGGSAALAPPARRVLDGLLSPAIPHTALHFMWNQLHTVWFVLLHLEHAGPSLTSMPAPKARV